MNFLKNNKGIFALMLSSLFLLVFILWPSFTDFFYRNFIFQLYRIVWDHTLALLPFALIYLLIVLLPFLLFYFVRKNYKSKHAWILLPLNIAGWAISLFLWTWGYNYAATRLREKVTTEMEIDQLAVFAEQVIGRINRISTSSPLELVQSPSQGELERISFALELEMKDHGVSIWGKPKLFAVKPYGILRKLGISGIYVPFTGEAHIDGSYLKLQQLFIAAHELSHAYGVTSEAEADFFAYKTLMSIPANDSALADAQYVAMFELLRSIRSRIRSLEPNVLVRLDSTLNDQVMNHLKLVRKNAEMFREFIPGMQEAMNDRYLRMMGVEEGTKSYDLFVELAYSDWQE